MQVFSKTGKYCDSILLCMVCLCLSVLSLGTNFKNPDSQVPYKLYIQCYNLGLPVNFSMLHSESMPTLILNNPDGMSYAYLVIQNST